MLFGQCSRHTGKSLLTFFFDGVPDEDSTSLVQAGLAHSGDSAKVDTSLLAIGSPEMLVHYPYAERECAACHDPSSLGSMHEQQPDLCYLCHEDFGTRYNYLHGPVAGGYCTSCHNPHLSEKEHLLRYVGYELCFHCHREESIVKEEMHADLDGMLCTECHNPHGGEDNFIFQ